MHRFQPSFRQRCASALTDPVTIGAVALLFVNDLVLKQLWQDSWLTGKLSDFAWLVFACPLRAFLLSLFTWRPGFLERLAVMAAYAGLPLVYLIFNSSATIHDLILSSLLPLTGSAAGSPLDFWDSLVIPFSMAVALWVWFLSDSPLPGQVRLPRRRDSLGGHDSDFAFSYQRDRVVCGNCPGRPRGHGDSR